MYLHVSEGKISGNMKLLFVDYKAGQTAVHRVLLMGDPGTISPNWYMAWIIMKTITQKTMENITSTTLCFLIEGG